MKREPEAPNTAQNNRPATRSLQPIRLLGVRQNNLKNISVEIPQRALTVITGVSGSGKSSLAFETLYAEGQRRYVESLSTYTRQFLEKMPKPELDSVQNIPPAIALEQKNHIVNSRSTVGTQTEIVDYLRVLFARIGRTHCVQCGYEVKQVDTKVVLDWAAKWISKRRVVIAAPLASLGGTEPVNKKASKSKKQLDTASLKQILQETGFRRVLKVLNQNVAGTPIQAEMIDLEDLPKTLTPPEKEKLWVVVDRIKTSVDLSEDSEMRTRLRDAIDQAFLIGKGNVLFYDLDQDAPEVSTEGESAKLWRKSFSCINCGREHRTLEPNLFSFNSPVGACSRCSGFGHTLELDEHLIVPDPSKTLKNGAIDPFSKPSLSDWQHDLFRFCDRNGISIGKRYQELNSKEKKLLWHGSDTDKTFQGIFACFEELKKYKYKLHIRVFIRRYQTASTCPDCKGARIQPDALAVQIGNKNLPQVLDTPITDGLHWLKKLNLSASEKKIGSEALKQVERRLAFLDEVGVGYLTLARLAKSLSGGEFQRINLATQLGNGLCGTLYVLDEPSIGLHSVDTERLIRVLKRLRDQGNTVVVVEHELEVMKHADWLIELGPLAGRGGGDLVAQGHSEKIMQTPGSLTGKYLSGIFQIKRGHAERPSAKRFIELQGCHENNLKHFNVKIPLDRLVVVTGVSGSGKSTLVHKILYQSLSKIFDHTNEPVGKVDRIYGADQIQGVVLLDQSPIGRNSRSNPATYLKAWDEVRRIYANQSLSLRRGYSAMHFSFNVDGGRCSVCKGEGEITLDMHFMAEIKLPCEECEGKRFKKAILDIKYRGKNIDQLLHTTIDEACDLFRDNVTLYSKFNILREVGLGYLQLGQSATTLSGGESQRLKIAATLDDRDRKNLLYIFDEPTTGLHLEDVKRLMVVLQDLVSSKQSIVMIEHHPDVIAQADWVIDLGPEGGDRGGHLVAEGTPSDLVKSEASLTGQMLKQHYPWLIEPGREA